MDPVAADLLRLWFGTTDLGSEMERNPLWFKSTPEFDARVIAEASDVHERAASGQLDHFIEKAESCLALVLALDQLPRNIYRGSPRAYDTDEQARETARILIDRGYDRNFSYFPRVFSYLPFEHSEELSDQDRSVSLFTMLGQGTSLDSAVAHREAIRRFGRFPHRNAILGRANTPEEEVYLEDPPLWGMTAAEAQALERRKSGCAEEDMD